MITPGLSFKSAFSVDYYDYYSEGYKEGYAVYEPVWANMNGKDMIIDLKQYGKDSRSASEFVGSSTYYQTMTFRTQFDYNRTFGKVHNVGATLMGWGYQRQNSNDSNHSGSSYHRTTNVNAGLRATYNYNHLYYAEFDGALVHSAKLAPSVLNQDLDISDYYMYKGYYDNKGGWYQWEDASQGGFCNTSKRGANTDLGFVKRKEWRIGLDASLWNGLLTVDMNYFHQLTDGLLTQGASTIYPAWFNGNGSFLPYLNYNQDQRSGFDFTVKADRLSSDSAVWSILPTPRDVTRYGARIISTAKVMHWTLSGPMSVKVSSATRLTLRTMPSRPLVR